MQKEDSVVHSIKRCTDIEEGDEVDLVSGRVDVRNESKGPSINDVTHLGGKTFVMMCDEGGEGFEKCDVTFKKLLY